MEAGRDSPGAGRRVRLLIIGAGPFGLAMAAHAKHLGIDHLVLGKPMDFWKANMPAGMHLRSACDWHLDPVEVHIIEKFLETRGLRAAEVKPRVLKSTIKLWPKTQVAKCDELPGGDVAVKVDNGQTLLVDHLILATGFEVQIQRVPFLGQGNILPKLDIKNGFPLLDERFRTNLPGLFITSMAATQNFGPFFAFTLAARTSAKLIGQAIAGRNAEKT
jgi:hypothetical protein